MTFDTKEQAQNCANWINEMHRKYGGTSVIVVAQPWEDGWEVVDIIWRKAA